MSVGAVDQVIEAGTHIVYIGRVQVVEAAPGTPLVYMGGEYWRPDTFEPSTFADYPEARPQHVASGRPQHVASGKAYR